MPSAARRFPNRRKSVALELEGKFPSRIRRIKPCRNGDLAFSIPCYAVLLFVKPLSLSKTAIQATIVREGFPISAHGESTDQSVNRAALNDLVSAFVVDACRALRISLISLRSDGRGPYPYQSSERVGTCREKASRNVTAQVN